MPSGSFGLKGRFYQPGPKARDSVATYRKRPC